MGEVSDLQRLLTLIMEETKVVMESEASSCLLYDEDREELYFKVALGEKAEGVKTLRIKRGETSFAGTCLDERKTLVVNDARSDCRHYVKADEMSTFVTRNLVAAPMIFHSRIVGVLEVLNKRTGLYDDLDVKIMEIVAEQAAVAIVNADLFERNVQRERLAAVGVAVSCVAHHLKNIIQTIKGSAGLIKLGTEQKKEKMVAESLPVLVRGTARMEQTVAEMLVYSKERKPEYEPACLNTLMADIIEECHGLAQDKGVTLCLETDARIGGSYLDKHRLHDAILNLVGNAIEAHAPGTDGAHVIGRTRLSKDGLCCVVEIEDNGPGMTEEVAKRIFQPFYSTKGAKGTGLGLAVAQKVAEENNGTLTVRSVPGQGSVFCLRFPIVHELAAAAGEPRPAS